MISLTRLCALLYAGSLVSAAVIRQEAVASPAEMGAPYSAGDADIAGATTASGEIAEAAKTVDQKSGPGVDETPDHEVPETVVTVVDGEVVAKRDLSSSLSRLVGASLSRRAPSDYTQIFAGTGTGPEDRDGSIEGTAYLTYTLINNATYNIEACLDYCSSVSGCVFANLYYEFNNYGLDFEASEKSNLKCAVYGDVHTAAEKTNRGAQQSYPAPAPLIYIQHSGGWASKSIEDPNPPEGYELVFGPTGGANNAPGYMGFVFLDKYDVDACARECNQRGPDRGGSCQYFNIWRAVVNGVPTTYTCAMYFIPTDESTAVNYGQGDLKVTLSRGYRRKNYIVDGGFEGYPCSSSFCFGEVYYAWYGTSPGGGYLDATIFHHAPYARTGSGVGLLGSAGNVDRLPGTLAPTEPLKTTAGKSYRIEFFQWSGYSTPENQAPTSFDVLWNGNVVLEVRPGFAPWTRYHVDVTAAGNDQLAFRGGSAPAWAFIDDVSVYSM